MKKPSKEKLILDAALKLFNQKGYEKSTMPMSLKPLVSARGSPISTIKIRKTCTWPSPKKPLNALEAEFKAIDKMTGKKGLELITELLNRYIDFAEKTACFMRLF
ncbi:hypothetical protein A3SI_00500 [Nitritalea halalkaliphila LW7]|uniref:Uncharacterized protein n=1 Tax=Nitritalea halalkaliphila LW7 TaxID=1189621 RepID=I5CAP6_9BACT|nr:TetR family transcriptional regulator [Nitritalea halalkaliphila]EIM78898.1 hypothetical protein A3SI_00500 [Nitritalea halalkaliphila LW7]